MEEVNLTFKVLWRFKEYPEIKITKCKKIVDCKRMKLINYTPKGFYIKGVYYKRNDINKIIEKIPKKEYCPFGNI